MQNKKNLILGAIFIAVVFFVVFYFFQVKKIFNNDSWLAGNKEEKVEVEEIKCEFTADNEIYTKIYENGGKNYCQCLKDKGVDKLEHCSNYANDIKFYQQALKDYNAENCEQIKSTVVKEECLLVVRDSLAQMDKLRKENPDAKVLTQAEVEKRNVDANYVQSNLDLIMKNIILYRSDADLRSKSLGDIDNLVTLAQELEKFNPNNARVQLVLGDLARLKNEDEAALKYYTRSIELGDNEGGYINRAITYTKLNKYDEAINDLEKANKNSTNEIATASYLCDLYFKKENNSQAKKNCERAASSENEEIRQQANKILELLK
ncbi:MAG: hypothetical protein WAV16_01375 [Candidatus Moraniibacteriota bacterium]